MTYEWNGYNCEYEWNMEDEWFEIVSYGLII